MTNSPRRPRPAAGTPCTKVLVRRAARKTEGTTITNPVLDAWKAIEAARVLKEQIAQLAAGDTEFIRDTLEGETDFEGIARSLLASIGEDEALIAGLKTYGDDLSVRRDRIATRVQLKRALLASALEIAERPKLELDIGTLSLTKVPPKAQVLEEADVPADYWQPQPPKLDLKSLTAALRDGKSVPGAALTNGGQTVTIRRR